MEFNWITPREAGEKWGITDRRVQILCSNGRIEGAIRLKGGWFIPKDSAKPPDGRVSNGRKPKSQKQEKSHE